MQESSPHILFVESYDQEAINRAKSFGRVTILSSYDEEALLNAVPNCDALLVRTRAQVSRRIIEAAPRLRVIGRGGNGLDNIDVDAARQRGIVVVHTPEASTAAAADLTVGLMLNLVRRIRSADRHVREGSFAEGREQCTGTELSEMTLGIVGMGRIGQAVARRCHCGFTMPILYNDIVDVEPLEFSATPVSKEYLFQQANIISLHVPLTDLTRHMIDAGALAEMKQSAYLINASRGAVVDCLALANCLIEKRIAGAALDVFDPEPLPDQHPLLESPNTLLTPHIGARTHGSLQRMNAVVDDVLGVLQGSAPQFPAH